MRSEDLKLIIGAIIFQVMLFNIRPNTSTLQKDGWTDICWIVIPHFALYTLHRKKLIICTLFGMHLNSSNQICLLADKNTFFNAKSLTPKHENSFTATHSKGTIFNAWTFFANAQLSCIKYTNCFITIVYHAFA